MAKYHYDEMKSIERFALGAIKLGVFLAFVNMLFVTKNHLAPFHFGKLTAFRIIVAIMVFFYVMLLYLDRERYRPAISRLSLLAYAYLGVVAFTSVTGADFSNSFWGSIERMGGLYNFFFYFIFFTILAGIFKTRGEWERLLTLSVAVSAYMAFYAMGQMLWLGDFFLGDRSVLTRPVGTTGNALFLGTFLLWNMFFAIYLFFRSEKAWQKVLLVTVFLYDAIMFVPTQSRGAAVGIAAGFFVMFVLTAIFSRSRRTRVVMLACLLIGAMAVGILFLQKDADFVKQNRYLQRFTDISLSAQSFETRLWTWSSGWQGFLDKPVLGWGTENFIYPFSEHYRPEHFKGYGSETWFDRAHNMPLDVLVEGGALGMASYLALWLAVAWYLLRGMMRDKEQLSMYIVFAGLFVAYHVHSLTIFNTYTGYLMLFLFLWFLNFMQYAQKDVAAQGEAQVAEAAIDESKLSKKERKKLRRAEMEKNQNRIFGKPNYVVLSMVGALVISGIVLLDIPSVRANYFAAQAAAAESARKYELVAPLYKKSAEQKSSIGEVEITERLAKFSVEAAASRTVDKTIASEALRYAVEREEKVLKTHPLDVKVRLILTRLYNLYWDIGGKNKEHLDRAEEVVRGAIKFGPSREQLYFELGQTLVLAGRSEEAVENYRIAYELTSDIPVSNYYYAMALYNWSKNLNSEGKQEKAAQVLEESIFYMDKTIDMGYLQGTAMSDYMRISYVYAAAKKYDKLLLVYESILELNPKEITIRSSRAAVYKEMGETEKARQDALFVIENSPNQSDKDEAKKFLEGLNQ